jgi:hypothetical protein
VVSLDGTIKALKANALTIWTYSITCVSHAWHCYVDGGGKKIVAIFGDFQEIRAWVLVVCSWIVKFPNQSLAMYR